MSSPGATTLQETTTVGLKGWRGEGRGRNLFVRKGVNDASGGERIMREEYEGRVDGVLLLEEMKGVLENLLLQEVC